MAKTNVAIIGASGYTGLELIKILINHPEFEISYLGGSGAEEITNLHPSLCGVYEKRVEITEVKAVAQKATLVFLALPHKTSMEYARELIKLGVKVVDLSADYRIKLETYEKFYCEHTDKENLPHAVYGLPELNQKKIEKAKLVANPGCYPTASLLALLPFALHVDASCPIFIDAKSGVSGAGKKLNQTTSFVHVNDNTFSYNPMSHRHEPEIQEKLSLVGKSDFEVHFVPQIIPVTRGMLVNVYCTLKQECDPLDVLKASYKDSQFVRVREEPVNIKAVSGTNYCDIFAKRKGKTLFLSSAIDNLLRGASSQAVVNANLMCGFEEGLGIPKISYAP